MKLFPCIQQEPKEYASSANLRDNFSSVTANKWFLSFQVRYNLCSHSENKGNQEMFSKLISCKKQDCDKHLIRQNTELFEFHEAASNFYCKILKCVTRTQTPLIYPRFYRNTKLSTGVLNKKSYCGAIKLLQKGYCVHSSQSIAFLKDVEFSPNHHLPYNELWKIISDVL